MSYRACMALKKWLMNSSKLHSSNAFTASLYSMSALARFSAMSTICWLLNPRAKSTIVGLTNMSDFVISCFSCMPSSDLHLDSATYACPPANIPPEKSMATLLNVNPWLLCIVIAHASLMGNCVNTPNSSSSIFFSFSFFFYLTLAHLALSTSNSFPSSVTT